MLCATFCVTFILGIFIFASLAIIILFCSRIFYRLACCLSSLRKSIVRFSLIAAPMTSPTRFFYTAIADEHVAYSEGTSTASVITLGATSQGVLDRGPTLLNNCSRAAAAPAPSSAVHPTENPVLPASPVSSDPLRSSSFVCVVVILSGSEYGCKVILVFWHGFDKVILIFNKSIFHYLCFLISDISDY